MLPILTISNILSLVTVANHFDIDGVQVSSMLFHRHGVCWWIEECHPWPLLVMVANASLRSWRYNRLSGWPNSNRHRSSSTPLQHLGCGPQPIEERIAIPQLSHLFLLIAASVTHHHLLPSCHSHNSMYLVLGHCSTTRSAICESAKGCIKRGNTGESKT